MTLRTKLHGMFAAAWTTMLVSVVAAAGPAPVGSLVGGRNVTLDGQSPLPHTTILSGDRLAVSDGIAMVALGRGNRMLLERGSEASFVRDGDAVAVSLARGDMSFFHPLAGGGIRIVAGDVTIMPASGSKTLSEIVMTDGLLVVTAKNGALEVEQTGSTRKVGDGSTITIATTAARAPSSAAAPAPIPSGGRYIKHIFNHETIVVAGVAAAGTGAAVAAIALTRSSKEVSPTVPSF